MKTLKEQTEAKVESGRLAKPKFMEGVDRVIAEQEQFESGSSALSVGSKA